MAYTYDGRTGLSWQLFSGTAATTPLSGTALAGVKDLNWSDSRNEIDVSDRDVTYKKYAQGLSDGSLTGTVLSESAAYAELLSCYDNNTTKAWGAKCRATSGDGFWFDGVVTSLTLAAPLEGAAEWSFTIRPTGAVTRVAA